MAVLISSSEWEFVLAVDSPPGVARATRRLWWGGDDGAATDPVGGIAPRLLRRAEDRKPARDGWPVSSP
jgi:hypothetical protein